MQNILPKDYLFGLHSFLNEGELKGLNFATLLSEVDLTLTRELIEIELANKTSIKIEVVKDAIEHFIGLILIKERSNIGAKEFAKELLEELQREGYIPTDYTKFSAILEILLDTNSKFYISVKSKELKLERERFFNNIRIITDLRPIFTDGDSCVFKKMSVMHTIKIVFEQNSEVKELFFGLDLVDLEDLKRQIDRSIEKENKLIDKFKEFII